MLNQRDCVEYHNLHDSTIHLAVKPYVPSRDVADRMKAFWAEHLDLLANQLKRKQKSG